jgi:hypothetical protein
LLTQHLDEPEHEAEEKGSVQQLLAYQFAKVFRVPCAPALTAAA